MKSLDYINASGMNHNDNRIDVSEAISADMPDRLFEVLEKDNDLIVTREEFANCVSYTDDYETRTIVIVDDTPAPARAVRYQSVRGYQFSILNRNADRDKHISREEALAWDISAETFARLDSNSDGIVTRDEFIACQTPQ